MRFLVLVGQAVAPALSHARIPKKITAFPPGQLLGLPHLASLGILPRQTRSHHLPHRGTCLHSSGSRFGSPGFRTPLAPRPAHRRHRRRSHPDRTTREALLRSWRLGGNAESRAFADSSCRPDSGPDEMVERLHSQNCQPDHGPGSGFGKTSRGTITFAVRISSTAPRRI